MSARFLPRYADEPTTSADLDVAALRLPVRQAADRRSPSAANQSGGEVGTGAGEGAPGQDTGSAWVTRSTDCPEAPAQAHLAANQSAGVDANPPAAHERPPASTPAWTRLRNWWRSWPFDPTDLRA